MAIEIERKFLIKNDSWKKDLVGQIYQQAYLSKSANKTVHIAFMKLELSTFTSSSSV